MNTSDEIIKSYKEDADQDAKWNDETNTIATNLNKKKQPVEIILISVSICCCLIKYQTKQNFVYDFTSKIEN